MNRKKIDRGNPKSWRPHTSRGNSWIAPGGSFGKHSRQDRHERDGGSRSLSWCV